MLDYGRAVDRFLNDPYQVVKVVPPDPRMAQELERIRRNRALIRYLRLGLSVGDWGTGGMASKTLLNIIDRFEQLKEIELTVRSIGASREAQVLLNMYFQKRWWSLHPVVICSIIGGKTEREV